MLIIEMKNLGTTTFDFFTHLEWIKAILFLTTTENNASKAQIRLLAFCQIPLFQEQGEFAFILKWKSWNRLCNACRYKSEYWENCQGSGPQLTELPHWYRSLIERTAKVQVLNCHIGTLIERTAKVQVLIWKSCYTAQNIERTAKVQVLNWQNCYIDTGHWLRELPRFRSSFERAAILHRILRELPKFRSSIKRITILYTGYWENCQGSGPQLTELPYRYKSLIERTAEVQVLNCLTCTSHQLKKNAIVKFIIWQNYHTCTNYRLKELQKFRSSNNCQIGTGHQYRKLSRFRSSFDRAAIPYTW